MCGIFGAINFPQPVEGLVIERATRALRHRGPDDEGYLLFDPATSATQELHGNDSTVKVGTHVNGAVLEPGSLTFGHRRLSIIDPRPVGRQPMSYCDGRYWITYNGEIYNYRELRNRLQASGHRFTTDTDTEVVLASYAQWGPSCLTLFNGMWSFAILDTWARTIFAARDRFGIKPFYYWMDGAGSFAFSSEPKALLMLPGIKKQLNYRRAYDFLCWSGMRVSPETFYEGIQELEPAHYVMWDLQERTGRLHRYYTLRSVSTNGSGAPTEADTLDTTRSLVRSAVARRLMADVPVGSCLSGGIDSSVIVGCIADLLKRERFDAVGDRQHVITACFPGTRIDETRYAADVVEQTRSRWLKTYPTGRDLWRDFDELVRAQGEPFNGPSVYAQYCVMRMASEARIKVLLDGQGADEIFGGYPVFYGAYLAELMQALNVRRLVNETAALYGSSRELLPAAWTALAMCAVGSLPRPCSIWLLQRFKNTAGLLNRDFAERHRERSQMALDRVVMSVNELSLRLTTTYTLPILLQWEDRNSMAWSIEARTPFADDHELIEYVARLPSRYKIQNGRSKVVLRNAASDWLPPSVQNRRDKLGFATPEREWMADGVAEARDLLSTADECIDTRHLVQKLPEYIKDSSPAEIRALWRVLIFRTWRRVAGV